MQHQVLLISLGIDLDAVEATPRAQYRMIVRIAGVPAATKMSDACSTERAYQPDSSCPGGACGSFVRQRNKLFQKAAKDYHQDNPDASRRAVALHLLGTVTNPGIDLRQMQEIIASVVPARAGQKERATSSRRRGKSSRRKTRN